jgi:hypothetical protein
MIPMDWRAPFIQQRWVELYNAGANEVPAFGVCEITGASRPENINGAQAGGRTVLNVTRPTEDSPNAVCLNGPMPIAAGAYGFGTLHYPAYAKYATANTPVAGEEWGAASGTFELTKGKSGFVIFGDAANGLVRVDRFPAASTGVPFRNDSGESAPAYAVMRVTGSATVDGAEYVTISKPNTDFKRKYLVNTGSAVADGEYGIGTWLSDADWVLYDDANTPAIGESWGPSSGSWELKKWRYGFTIVGNPSGGATDIVRAWQEEANEFRGKTDSTHNKGSTGTISIYDGNKADTTDNMASVENDFANVASGKWVGVRWWGGKWCLVAAEC